MAAPTPDAPATPDGIHLDDGHPTKITIAADTNISFWERTVTPPGIDGGDVIDVTTMYNTTWRTMRPRSLATLTAMSCSALYDPDIYDEILAVTNVETTITITYPDGSTLAFYGYVRSAEFDEISEGEPPSMTVNIEPTNFDATNNVEAGPLMTEVAGT